MFLKARKIKTILSVGCFFGFKCFVALLRQISNKSYMLQIEKNFSENLFRGSKTTILSFFYEITYESRFTPKNFEIAAPVIGTVDLAESS
jgi:hypothetical protein